MTEQEKKICNQYSKRDEEGIVHCFECPLVIDKDSCYCVAVKDEEECRRKNLILEEIQKSRNSLNHAWDEMVDDHSYSQYVFERTSEILNNLDSLLDFIRESREEV